MKNEVNELKKEQGGIWEDLVGGKGIKKCKHIGI